jgi:hydrogenase-4 transcriptional activator
MASSRDSLGNQQPADPVAAGKIALEESRFEEAASHFRSALRMGVRSAEEEALIRCYLSEALEKRGLHPEQLEAVARYDKFSEFARLSDHTQMLVLIRLGWGYSFTNDIPRAIALFNQAIQIARRLEDHFGLGVCSFGLGRAYRNFSELRIARDHYTSALDHFRQIGDWRKLSESYIHIGYINAFEGDYRTALHSLKQALAIIGNKDEPDLLGRIYMYLAITHDNLGSTDRAIACWEQCLDHFRQAGNSSYLAINQNNLAEKLIWLGQWDRAEQLIKSALDILSKTVTVAQYGGTIDTLAQLYVLQGKIEEADRLLQQSLDLLSSVKNGEIYEISTRVTIGQRHLMKDEPDQAVSHLERAIEICVRSGEHHFLSDARLWMAETLIQKGRADEAREIVHAVQAELRESPNMRAWGLMMRLVAKIEAASGYTAAAIQSLGQSTSMYELRHNTYACAVNSMVMAGMLERQGKIKEATSEVEAALKTFELLGAAIDERRARTYLESLRGGGEPEAEGGRMGGESLSKKVAPDLASAVDGFIARRIVQASISRELLLYELVSIARAQASARAALVVEVGRNDEAVKQGVSLKAVAAIGLTEAEQREQAETVGRISAQDYGRYFLYPFSDNQQSNFLLRIIEPRADRFLAGGVSLDPLLCLVEQGLETQLLKGKNRRTQVFNPARLLAEVELPGFVCASRAMSRVLEQIHKIRSSDVTVLITGESGTGKELIARAVHAGSSRRYKIFLPFNCSAAPREMIESQLFGYRKGSFTGAVASNPGIIRASEGGTLFLDEMGDLPLDLQPKLLRFLQEGEIHPIGENQPQRVAVRVVAATNSDLERAVVEGRFREDLFHRLNVIRIQVPPLRERREEIPALINYYMNLYQQEAAKRDIQLSEETGDLMVVYNWPGNVRQLCNEIRRIVAYSESGTLVTPDTLSPEIVRAGKEIQPAVEGPKPVVQLPVQTSSNVTLSVAVEELERRMIQHALHRSAGNIARAAKELGLSRKGLYLKMDRLNFKI